MAKHEMQAEALDSVGSGYDMGQFCSHSCDNSGPEDRVLASTTALFAVLWWATRTRPERHIGDAPTGFTECRHGQALGDRIHCIAPDTWHGVGMAD